MDEGNQEHYEEEQVEDKEQEAVKPLSRLVATFEDGQRTTLFITRNPQKILVLEWLAFGAGAEEHREDALARW